MTTATTQGLVAHAATLAVPDGWLFPAYKGDEHLMGLGARGDYLNVQNRMVWFLTDQRAMIANGAARGPYTITSELIKHDAERKFAQYKVTITDVLGNRAEAYGSEEAKDFGDYIEKAETKAKGRALLDLGYGTAFVYDDEGERVVDSPRQQRQQSGQQRQQTRQDGRQQTQTTQTTQTSAHAGAPVSGRSADERARVAAENRALGKEVGLGDAKAYTKAFLDHCHITPDADGVIRSTDEQADAWTAELKRRKAAKGRGDPTGGKLVDWQPDAPEGDEAVSFELSTHPALSGAGRSN